MLQAITIPCSVDEGKPEPDVIWIQKVDQNRNNIEMRPPTTATKAEKSEAKAVSPVRGGGNESRPATARTSLVYSNTVTTTKGDPNERKIKLLNKTLKSLRVDISNLQKENQTMRKVRNTNMYSREIFTFKLLLLNYSAF